MQPFKRYCQLYELTDPRDPIVAADITRGARWGYGKTDVHDHLPRLRELARGNVLEIGVRFGSTTAALLTGVEDKGGYLWSVDTEPCEFARSLFDQHPLWTFIQSDSKKIADLPVMPAAFDLIFIDGDHTYEGVLADLMNFGPRATTVALHDANHVGNPQVMRAIGEYLKSRVRHRKMFCYRDSNGLAVLS